MGVNAAKASYEVCCEQTYDKDRKYFGVDNLSDQNTQTYWHSKWHNNATDSNHPEGKHYITVKFDQPTEVSGFEYTPRQESEPAATKWCAAKLDCKVDKQDGSVETISGQTQCTAWNRSMQRLIFDKQVSGVKEMKLF